MWIKTEQDHKSWIFLYHRAREMHCVILLPWFALLKVRSITSPKIWVELQVLNTQYFITFFKKATGLGHLWINWGPSKCARIDPSNLQKTETLQELWELCLHLMCAHVLPFYPKSKGMLMGCRIPVTENHSPPRKCLCFCPHRSTAGIWSLTSAAGVKKIWPVLSMQGLQNTWPILYVCCKSDLINANELAKSEHSHQVIKEGTELQGSVFAWSTYTRRLFPISFEMSVLSFCQSGQFQGLSERVSLQLPASILLFRLVFFFWWYMEFHRTSFIEESNFPQNLSKTLFYLGAFPSSTSW